MLRVLSYRGDNLSVTLAADHVDHAESRHDVGYHVTLDHFVKSPHCKKTRRPDADTVWPAGAVADDVESQFAVAAFDRKIGFTRRHFDAFHNDLEMVHQ